MPTTTLLNGDCLTVLPTLPPNSIDAIVTDPPYGLSFMGKRWDYDVPSSEIWAECLRVLKPGGHLLAFAGTRTQHRMACRIEDAGFEIRDMIAWIYGSGFPKSLDVSKAIDKAAGAEREVIGFDAAKAAQQTRAVDTAAYGNYAGSSGAITAPATDAARQWSGWGTALKPALEPITVARKPLSGTVAENVLAHGTGALNIDGCRVEIDPRADASQLRTMRRNHRDGGDGWGMSTVQSDEPQVVRPDGRWPANLIHDGNQLVMDLFPQSAGQIAAVRPNSGTGQKTSNILGKFATNSNHTPRNDSGSAARFFYCAKASKADRDEGCEGMEAKLSSSMPGRRDADDMSESKTDNDVTDRFTTERRNHHPTVKPTALMRYLCRLVTPPSGTVLDPFMGSGSTGKAASLENFNFIGIEREAEYIEIAKARIERAKNDA